ncbi:MAG: hypothetical protein A3F91_08845 [Flavobacteria bacterium RIFCSPLOWO2_12_FULL_35_11]|nr:MAG: hypothetical protein A3F91_08845 [Flavobacteria bacterium RIFCSPLOWO2_12_FULL_35_11]
MKNLIFIAFLVISNSLFGQGFDMTVTGNWTRTIDASDIGEAGSDYPATFTSNLNQTLLTIDPKNKNKTFVVFVHKEDIAWIAALTLKIRRTSNGTNGNNSINGGLNYQVITNNDANFFTCSDLLTFVQLQYEITGISILLPVQSYSTSIMFTVMLQ